MFTPISLSQRFRAAVLLASTAMPMLHAQAQTEAADDTIFTLDPFTVVAATTAGYVASNSISGTRVNMQIQDLPQNLLVLTEELLRDVAATTLFQALEYAGGVVQGSERDTPNSVIIRGFSTDWPLRNGIKRVGAVAGTSNISRVEIIKGPAAILYGQSGLGGVVNYITKTPVAGRTFGSLNLAAGSYDHYRVEADFNLPLSETVLTRWIGAAQTNNSFIDHYENEVVFFAPSLEWRPFDGFSIRFDAEYYKQQQTAPVSALPRYNHPDRVNAANSYFTVAGLDGLVPVPRNFNINAEGTFRDIEIPTFSTDTRWTPRGGLGMFDRFSVRNVLYTHTAEREQLAALVGSIDRVHRIAPALLISAQLFLGPELIFRDTAVWSPTYRWAQNKVYTVQNEVSLGKDFNGWSLQALIGQEYFRDERMDRRRTIGGAAGDRAADLSFLLRAPIVAPTLEGAQFPTQLVTGPQAARFQELYPEYPLTPEDFTSQVF
ncbi:MAG: TonB-dependent receptor plug domain-containing protein [Verrucomicrobia bacterium]|nr:TonB-dependent receptor plug domain-containing protein [Verrucomicrobiota bacterium]